MLQHDTHRDRVHIVFFNTAHTRIIRKQATSSSACAYVRPVTAVFAQMDNFTYLRALKVKPEHAPARTQTNETDGRAQRVVRYSNRGILPLAYYHGHYPARRDIR